MNDEWVVWDGKDSTLPNIKKIYLKHSIKCLGQQEAGKTISQI